VVFSIIDHNGRGKGLAFPV